MKRSEASQGLGSIAGESAKTTLKKGKKKEEEGKKEKENLEEKAMAGMVFVCCFACVVFRCTLIVLGTSVFLFVLHASVVEFTCRLCCGGILFLLRTSCCDVLPA